MSGYCNVNKLNNNNINWWTTFNKPF